MKEDKTIKFTSPKDSIRRMTIGTMRSFRYKKLQKCVGLIIFQLVLVSAKSQINISKQDLVNNFGFVQHEITVDQEEIVFYTYQKDDSKKSGIVLYLQGSDPSPLFSYKQEEDEIKKMCFLRRDFQNLDSNYIYVAVEKIGFEQLIDETKIPLPMIYQEKNSLDNRVFRANEVINSLNKIHQFSKIVVYGHSEGAPVGAKLAVQNDKITHLGFWAGNAMPDFYDFILEVRKEYYQGNLSIEETQDQINEIINGFVHEVAADPTKIESEGYTNLRWWSYAEPPLYNLLKLDIPIFVQVATEDKSAPIESTYLIPLEFARLKKDNLTYKVCIGCDHGFNIYKDGIRKERKWNEIFLEFMDWVDTNTF
ncbi:MAG: hypothetical protein AAGA77_25230 [Bacteroidota bacterium]